VINLYINLFPVILLFISTFHLICFQSSFYFHFPSSHVITFLNFDLPLYWSHFKISISRSILAQLCFHLIHFFIDKLMILLHL
jgi:hypothetical protein